MPDNYTIVWFQTEKSQNSLGALPRSTEPDLIYKVNFPNDPTGDSNPALSVQRLRTNRWTT